jgi:HK97 family phage major capsid protein
MAAVASASKSVAFGDFAAYHVREVTPMAVAISTEYKFDTDQIAIKTTWRVDGDLPDVAAIAYLVSAGS